MKKSLVVITGASSGFGAEIAKLFNQAGNPLLLLGRSVEKIEALPLNFENVMIEKVDVTDYQAFDSSIKKAEAVFGPVDLLVNNAGVMLLGNVLNQNPAEWQTMMNTNVMGVLNGMQIVLPSMTERRQGTIINMSSLAGKKTFTNHAAYVASKFGAHGLSETIREEVSGSNVRVSLVAWAALHLIQFMLLRQLNLSMTCHRKLRFVKSTLQRLRKTTNQTQPLSPLLLPKRWEFFSRKHAILSLL